jgi:hypothetical protein
MTCRVTPLIWSGTDVPTVSAAAIYRLIAWNRNVPEPHAASRTRCARGLSTVASTTYCGLDDNVCKPVWGVILAEPLAGLLARRATNKCHPHAVGSPNLFHIGTRLGLIHTEHIATIPVEKGRDSVVRDAMDVYGDFL